MKRTSAIPLTVICLCVFGGQAWAGQVVQAQDLPPPVKQTLDREAKGATILEIEKEVEDGRTFYEIDYRLGQSRVEVEIAPNGALLSKDVDEGA